MSDGASELRRTQGGIVHTYQKYDPTSFPSPTRPEPSLVSGAFDHLMAFGNLRELTDEELARAVRIDPAHIRGLGPSLESLIELLEQRRRKILATYQTERARALAASEYSKQAGQITPPKEFAAALERIVAAEQIRELEQLWYRAGAERSPFARTILGLIEALGRKYQVDELAARYAFTGRTPMTVVLALQIKEELETIDRLLKQLREAMKNAQVALIDLSNLARFAPRADVERLSALAQQIQDRMREMARRQGLERTDEGYRLTPKAWRLFQSTLLGEIFSALKAGRSGRHSGPIAGEGVVEMQRTRPYAFGDSVAHMDIPGSLTNAMIREAGAGRAARGPVRIEPRDIEIHDTRNSPKCATVVIIDMSGSMRFGGQYIQGKRMALALDGLIRQEYPGDFLRFVEMYTFARQRHISEIPGLLPKPVTLYDPVVRLRADMSDHRITELDVPPHFTNIQHALRIARRLLAPQDTPNRQIILITDGLPTAHFEGETLYLLYPPDPRTERATMHEATSCAREGIILNAFVVPSRSQSREDVQFAHRLVEASRGRVFFTGGRDLERCVVWDYVQNKRRILG